MRSAPDPNEIRVLLSDLLKHGDRVKLANVFGVTESAISQRLNPNSNGHCRIADGLYDAWAICGVNSNAGRALKTYIFDLFESWLGVNRPTSSDEALADASHDFADILSSRLKHKPLREQLREAVTAQSKLAEFIEGVERELRAENSGNVAQIRP